MDEVVLLDGSLVPCGQAPKLSVHHAPGRLHLAFSLVLADRVGRVLLQRRSGTKHHFRHRWANSCCSHPRPGEPILAAAARRANEELGAEVSALREVGSFTYRAVDPDSGLVEHEHDIVVLGGLASALSPEPHEVGATQWLPLGEARDLAAARPTAVAPWCESVLKIVATHVAGDAHA